MTTTANDAREWFRHEMKAKLYFMVTEEERVLDSAEPHLEGVVLDMSEAGMKIDSPIPLSEGDQISFEVVGGKQEKTVFSGVASIVHGNNDLNYGASYIKIRKH